MMKIRQLKNAIRKMGLCLILDSFTVSCATRPSSTIFLAREQNFYRPFMRDNNIRFYSLLTLKPFNFRASYEVK